MGAGAALFDADNDGDLDAYLVQGHSLEAGLRDVSGLDTFYRNDLGSASAGSTLRFTDVTEASGLPPTGYGMGVAAGDFDNDGWIDLYVTSFGTNHLLRNEGLAEGADAVTFTDVTTETATGDDRWSVPAVFFDYDRDGWLDLYVGNYLAMSLEQNQVCRAVTGERDYCAPDAYPSAPDRLFRNRGPDADGRVRFEDVTRQAGLHLADLQEAELHHTELHHRPSATLGAVAADLDGNGWIDLYVANDRQPNHLWLNQGLGPEGHVTFRNEARLAGCAVNGDGFSEASMGIATADVDGDGDLDLFVTHLTTETNTLYLNDGNGIFEDRTIASGLGPASAAMTAFGTGFLDLDSDGWLDLVTVNGAVKKLEELTRQRDPSPFHQPNQLFHNQGLAGQQGVGTDGQTLFEQISDPAGAALGLSETSRGAAFGDVDNDGVSDVLITNNNGQARLYRNQPQQSDRARHHWLGLQLASDLTGHTVGARVALDLVASPTLWRVSHGGGSYASSGDPRLLFGLGEKTDISRVRVYWSNGDAEAWPAPQIDAYTTLRKGTGAPL